MISRRSKHDPACHKTEILTVLKQELSGPLLVLSLLGGVLVPTFLLSETVFAEAVIQHYEVKAARDLAYLDVRTCFPAARPVRLQASGFRARAALQWMRIEHAEGGKAVDPAGRMLHLPRIESGDCVVYRVDLPRQSVWRDRTLSSEVVVGDPDDWLWLPPAGQATAEVRFQLPRGVDISVPWPPSPTSDDTHTFRLPARSSGWNARVAIGRMTRFDTPMAGTRLRIAVIPGDPPADINMVRDWIASGAKAMTTLQAPLAPLPPVQLLVIPVGPAEEPVPWAEVQRGGGDAVHLFIDQYRSRRAFLDDWTLVHELSHLLHPRMPQTEAWLYEGLASYYQNVLRARAELLSPLAAWRKLHAGFRRGMRDTIDSQPLYRVSGNMSQNGRYMQIYWSGAAFALEVDTHLRQRSNGRQSLDRVLARFLDCCLPADRPWEGEAFIRQLDALSETRLFSETYERYRRLRQFPHLDSLYRELGVKVRHGRLQFDDRAPLAPIRKAIMSLPTTAED